jgi:hypothetical protein
MSSRIAQNARMYAMQNNEFVACVVKADDILVLLLFEGCDIILAHRDSGTKTAIIDKSLSHMSNSALIPVREEIRTHSTIFNRSTFTPTHQKHSLEYQRHNSRSANNG